MDDDAPYANIRQILGYLIGKRIVDVTQHDREDFDTEGSYVMLLMEGGHYLKVPVGDDGFDHSGEQA
jgi:hypothetical protein